MYNCTTLDAIERRVIKMLVRSYVDGKLTDAPRELDSHEAAREVAGIFTRKFLGEKIIVRKRYDYGLGAWLVESVNYGNGWIQRYEYVY